MEDLVKSAIKKSIDRAAGTLATPAHEHSHMQTNETDPTASMTGQKRKQPSAAPSSDSTDVEIVDMTRDVHPHNLELATPVKRQRLTSGVDSALQPATSLATVAASGTMGRRYTTTEYWISPLAASAQNGLLSPENTPQKQREHYEGSRYADSVYATSGKVRSLVEVANSAATTSERLRNSTTTTPGAADITADMEVIKPKTDSPPHSPPAGNSDDTSAKQVLDSTSLQAEHVGITALGGTPHQDQPIPRPAAHETQTQPETSQDVQLSSRELHQIPEIAQRFAPKTSTAEGVEYTNPQKFSLKPPYWKRWSPQQYARFAEHLRGQFDPRPFAQEQGLPVEEIMHCFTSVVCNPLWDADVALRRGEEGMVAQMEAVGKYGTPSRSYGREKGVVVLAIENGSKYRMRLVDLVEDDVKFLKELLSAKDKEVLWEGHAMGVPYGMSTGLRTWTMRASGKKAFAELVGVVRDGVALHLKDERKVTVRVDQLVDGDTAYLRDVLSKKDMAVLWPTR
ncbi:hypothetical protein B0A55_10761 [Friedmanniomyces simplex]|uniref:Uncharacterized protein n=1 Tax=Friedmanniomyces simplex TaxID=329884 RepID=A0A4U0WHQ4_9PEZI|nr:hypothetical protein B0A55_10761 [Friedmanniomyces simplex]